MEIDINKILKPLTDKEREILKDEEFRKGLLYGRPRRGHPEGQVVFHVKEVLDNVSKYAESNELNDLRLIALIHDTFKYKVDNTKPKSGENHHAMIARRFAEKHHLSSKLCDIIELHDEAYNSWQQIERKSDYHARERAERLIKRLGENLPLYLKFYRCDNETGDKTSQNYEWFLELTKEPSK